MIRAAIPRARIWKLFDSLGLILEIHPSGGKYWRLKYRFAGREKRLSLGVFPAVSTAQARRSREQAREQLAAGIDPSELRKEERAARHEEHERREPAARFMLDSDGALSFKLDTRRLNLTAAETSELRTFLDATRAVIPRV